MYLVDMYNSYEAYLKIYNSPGYVKFTKEINASIIGYFGNIDSSSLDVKKMLDYITYLQSKKYSNNTINKRISYLKRLYKFHDLDCPFYKVKKLKEKFITYGCAEDNISDLFPVIFKNMSLRNKLIIMLFYDTGIRLNELCHILMKNIDNENRMIYLEYTKTSKPRYIYYSKMTQKLIDNFCKNANRKYLFVGNKNDEKISRHTVESIFKRIREKYGLKKISPHRLRHSFSTDLYKNGADLLLISGILGHSNVNTTKRYIHDDHKNILKNYDKFHK